MSRHASGLKAWVVQRATAAYLAVFCLYLLGHFTLNPPASHAELLTWVTQPLVEAGLLLFIPILLAHAWIGIRDILIDYLQILSARVVVLSLFAFMFIASGLWAMKAVIAAGVHAGIVA